VSERDPLLDLLLRDPEHPEVRRLLLRHRERLLAELRDTEELLGMEPSVPSKRARPTTCDERSQQR
jgi:hypothetical protein